MPGRLALPDVDAVVVALKIRSIAAGRPWRARARRPVAARARRGPRALQDLLDLRFHRCRQYRSGDRGARADAGEAIVLVTPAFPETGRTVYLGHLFVGDSR